MLRAVIFDMGGTLLRFMRPGAGTWRELESPGIRSLYRYLIDQGHPIASHEDDFVEAMFERHKIEPTIPFQAPPLCPREFQPKRCRDSAGHLVLQRRFPGRQHRIHTLDGHAPRQFRLHSRVHCFRHVTGSI